VVDTTGLIVRVNGADAGVDAYYAPDLIGRRSCNVAWMFALNAGDYVQIAAYQTSGNTLTCFAGAVSMVQVV
jgi:hypothetical protein